MKAVVCTTLGEPNLLEIKDSPIPEPQKNEVLRKVEAAGIMKEIKKKRYFMKPSDAKKYKRKLAAKRRKKIPLLDLKIDRESGN